MFGRIVVMARISLVLALVLLVACGGSSEGPVASVGAVDSQGTGGAVAGTGGNDGTGGDSPVASGGSSAGTGGHSAAATTGTGGATGRAGGSSSGAAGSAGRSVGSGGSAGHAAGGSIGSGGATLGTGGAADVSDGGVDAPVLRCKGTERINKVVPHQGSFCYLVDEESCTLYGSQHGQYEGCVWMTEYRTDTDAAAAARGETVTSHTTCFKPDPTGATPADDTFVFTVETTETPCTSYGYPACLTHAGCTLDL